MTQRSLRQVRSLLALTLFATGGGGEQIVDALVFHRGAMPIENARVNGDDHCHAEQCVLGARLATPPPIDPVLAGGRYEPPIRERIIDLPATTPRAVTPTLAHAPRAPPSVS